MALISPRGDDLLAYFKVSARVSAGKVVKWAGPGKRGKERAGGANEASFRFLL